MSHGRGGQNRRDKSLPQFVEVCSKRTGVISLKGFRVGGRSLVRTGKEVAEELVINKEQVSSIHQPLKEMIYEAFT